MQQLYVPPATKFRTSAVPKNTHPLSRFAAGIVQKDCRQNAGKHHQHHRSSNPQQYTTQQENSKKMGNQYAANKSGCPASLLDRVTG
ncbi:MAG TPA: hypothetical protein VJ654_05980 [Noviherbaspirillum sp.]|nr:hypothetical protein [Noviherbaspirillum sp.]